MSEPREFWIDYNLNPIMAQAKPVMKEKPSAIMEPYYTHVIEHTAYEAEKARADKAERMLRKAVEQRNNFVMIKYNEMFQPNTAKRLSEKKIVKLDAELEGV
jgi:hypothetical protein